MFGVHLDSVSDGDWLDGCLNALAGLEVLRRLAEEEQPPLTVRIVSCAEARNTLRKDPDMTTSG